MPPKTALDRLTQLLAEHPHSPGSQRVTLADLRELRDRIDWLTAEAEPYETKEQP
jgi:hypothetical protein